MVKRKQYLNEIVVLGGDNDVDTKTYSTMSSFRKKDNEWKETKLKPFHFPRSCFSIVRLDNFLFIIGGFDGNRSIASVECYDFLTNEWTIFPSLRYRRSSCCSVAWNNKIYVIGGVARTELVNEIEQFDLTTGKWSSLTKDIAPTSGGGSVFYNQKIYNFGGYCDTNVNSNKLVVYDLKKETWKMFKPMKKSSSSFGYCLFFLNNEPIIVVVGGVVEKKKISSYCQYYNILENEWYKMGPLKEKRKYCSLVSYMGKLHVVGGNNGTKCLQAIESYDFEKKCWTKEYENDVILCGQGVLSLEGLKLEKKKNTLQINDTISWTGTFRNKKREGCFLRVENETTNEIYFFNNVILPKIEYDFYKKIKRYKIPCEFICPISFELMRDPVITTIGNTYEREHIEKWLVLNETDPLTNSKVDRVVFPNIILKKLIQNFIEKKMV